MVYVRSSLKSTCWGWIWFCHPDSSACFTDQCAVQWCHVCQHNVYVPCRLFKLSTSIAKCSNRQNVKPPHQPPTRLCPSTSRFCINCNWLCSVFHCCCYACGVHQLLDGIRCHQAVWKLEIVFILVGCSDLNWQRNDSADYWPTVLSHKILLSLWWLGPVWWCFWSSPPLACCCGARKLKSGRWTPTESER